MLPEKNRPLDLDTVQEQGHPSRAARYVNKLIVAALLVIAVGVGIILNWSFQPEDVLVVNNSPFPVRTIRDHPTAGGVVILSTDYCKNQAIDGKLRISFVSSSKEVFLPISNESMAKGCRKVEIPIIIPKDLPADEYKIKFRSTYDINPLKREVVVEFESQTVTID